MPDFHSENFRQLADSLRGQTYRAVVSIVDTYEKTKRRWKELEGTPAAIRSCDPERFAQLMRDMVASAQANKMNLVSCAEPIELQTFGIRPGKCVDDALLEDVFGIHVTRRKDPTQREACGCVVSRDIGMYDSCVYGCPYCYATRSFEQARVHLAQHDPNSPSMLGSTAAPTTAEERCE